MQPLQVRTRSKCQVSFSSHGRWRSTAAAVRDRTVSHHECGVLLARVSVAMRKSPLVARCESPVVAN